MTPSIAILHIQAPGRRGHRLWLPLFLLWIPFLLLSPLLLLAFAVFCLLGRVAFWRGLAALWSLLCALPGTDLLVDAEGAHVLLRLL